MIVMTCHWPTHASMKCVCGAIHQKKNWNKNYFGQLMNLKVMGSGRTFLKYTYIIHRYIFLNMSSG